MRWIVALLSGLAFGAFALTAAAVATVPPVYPPGTQVSVSTNQRTYAVEVPVIVTAHGCVAGTTVTFTVSPDGRPAASVLTATADTSGAATVSVDNASLGPTTVTAECGGTTAATVFEVSVPPKATDGGSRSTLVGAAILVVVLGAIGGVAYLRRRAPLQR